MTTMKKIIDKLAVEFDCQMHHACNHNSHFKPVFIGDVLEYIINEKGLMPLKGVALMIKWQSLGLSKSLQEIEAWSEYSPYDDTLKDPNAQALSEFINSII